MGFSERMGIVEPRDVLQLDGMDGNLRIALFNRLYGFFNTTWEGAAPFLPVEASGRYGYADASNTAVSIWTDHWKRPMDEWPGGRSYFLQDLKEYVMESQWNRVYDLVEFILDDYESGCLVEDLNDALEKEMSGYRIVGAEVIPISDECELQALEESLAVGDGFAGARVHISSALEKLSLRPEPDLRNAVKEAISAVESAACAIAGDANATLGKALSVLEDQECIHPALKKAWSSMYGYTSDEDGIRHALSGEDASMDFATAKYMVVACSAFVNLLVASGLRD